MRLDTRNWYSFESSVTAKAGAEWGCGGPRAAPAGVRGAAPSE